MGLPDFPWTTGPRDYDLPDEVLDAHGSPIATGAEYGGCSSDPFGYPYVVYEPGVAAFIVSCVRAIENAAAKLGMDPATLAERCANGEIGTLVEQSREAHAKLTSCIPHSGGLYHQSVLVADELYTALQPFRGTT